MILVLLIGLFAFLGLIACGIRLYRTRPIELPPLAEPPTPAPTHTFRRVHGHHYRLRLPDNMKLRIHDEER